ncbi:hypothetical protein [Niveispirillum sp. KHB5.9]|uniref:hypothetical protein n=1 Tax=Niveispirillum sp. KHB5.9 TaxID=3400269 RepID=UPI003A87B093
MMEEVKAYLPLFVFVAVPLFQWLFSFQLARRRDVKDLIKVELESRDKAIAALGASQGELAKKLGDLHVQQEVMRERVAALPTKEELSRVTVELAGITGHLRGALDQFGRVQDAVARHDDIIAEAARAGRRVPGGE